jgi:hypothetical protein
MFVGACRRGSLLIGAFVLTLSVGSGTALAVPVVNIGTKLMSGPQNDLVCKFKPVGAFPENRHCGITQSNLDLDDEATGGLTAPFNGKVIRWSVVAGPRSANTGEITLALRTGKRGGPVYQGPEVPLPANLNPGSRVDFVEDLPIEEGAYLALRIGIRSLGSEEVVGAPLAFATSHANDATETWIGGTGEPWPPGGGSVETIRNQALLLEAEIASTEDTTAPILRRRFGARQALGRRAAVRVRSSEAGAIRASGRLRIAGQEGAFPISSELLTVKAKRWTVLPLPVRGRAGRAVRAAEAEGRRVMLSGRIVAFDGSPARNSSSLPFRIRSRRGAPVPHPLGSSQGDMQGGAEVPGARYGARTWSVGSER